jgi:methionyl-tRNA formyltransferase
MTLRIIFMGTPAFAAASLSQIAMSGHEVVSVYTQPPRPAGRGQSLRRSAVHETAEALGLPVETPQTLRNEEVQAELAAMEPDLIIVVAYGQILPRAVLDIPSLCCLNLHASLLPRWRGAAPIQRAIMAGDTLTGVQIMQMEEGLDTGPIFMTETVPIHPDDTGGTLHDRLAQTGANLWFVALAALQRGAAVFTEQAELGVTYAAKITREDRVIDWTRPAVELERQVRALGPSPGAFAMADLGKGEQVLKILGASVDQRGNTPTAQPGTIIDDGLGIQTGAGVLRLAMVQPAGKPLMDARAFMSGQKNLKGMRLS